MSRRRLRGRSERELEGLRVPVPLGKDAHSSFLFAFDRVAPPPDTTWNTSSLLLLPKEFADSAISSRRIPEQQESNSIEHDYLRDPLLSATIVHRRSAATIDRRRNYE